MRTSTSTIETRMPTPAGEIRNDHSVAKSIMRWLIFSIALLNLLVARADFLNSMEQALMPGPLHKSHAKFETDCTNCHVLLKKTFQNDHCLKCHDHENVARDIESGKGFHGRIPDVKTRECKGCHAEHKGRDSTLVLLDAQTFNHTATDYPLRGRHTTTRCTACHAADKKYHQAASLCYDCHGSKDPHQSKLGKQCEDCHNETGWAEFKFDHARTKFALRGKHKEVTCRDCHPQERYKGVPLECVGCHATVDKHQGSLGNKCAGCHNETKWKDFIFDHGQTKFPLDGKHKGVACAECHPKHKYKDVPVNCHGCHKKDDKHKGQFGEKCKDCHNTLGWATQKFNHDKDTKFPLEDAHARVLCAQCHKPEDKNAKLKTDCYSCHKLRDEHQGLYGEKCKDCHNVKRWKEARFDHSSTKFALHGKHEKTKCKDCHPGHLYNDKLPTKCLACHRSSDTHGGQLGELCERCHNESGWSQDVKFDHNLVSFPLLGAHAALACEECHQSGNFKNAKPRCATCHDKDDVHKHRLSSRCERCHFAKDWKAWKFDHGTQTHFELKGAHRGIVCQACHKTEVTDKFDTPKECGACHADQDVHQGAYGRWCQRCHDQESFKHVTKPK